MQENMKEEEHIKIAYNLLLGREPEDEIAINSKRGLSISELREVFIKSYEFRIIHRNKFTPKVFPEPFTALPIEQIKSNLESIVNQWTILGEQDPY